MTENIINLLIFLTLSSIIIISLEYIFTRQVLVCNQSGRPLSMYDAGRLARLWTSILNSSILSFTHSWIMTITVVQTYLHNTKFPLICYKQNIGMLDFYTFFILRVGGKLFQTFFFRVRFFPGNIFRSTRTLIQMFLSSQLSVE